MAAGQQGISGCIWLHSKTGARLSRTLCETAARLIAAASETPPQRFLGPRQATHRVDVALASGHKGVLDEVQGAVQRQPRDPVALRQHQLAGRRQLVVQHRLYQVAA